MYKQINKMQSFFPHSGTQANGAAPTMNIADHCGIGERAVKDLT